MTERRGPSADDERELLSAYLDGELDEAETARAGARLAADHGWRAELDALRLVRDRVRSLPEREPPAGFIDQLVRAGRSDLARRSDTVHATMRRTRRLAASAAAAAAIGVAFAVPSTESPTPVRPAIDESADGHAVNAALADDPISQLAPAAIPASTGDGGTP